MAEGREGDWECSGCKNRNYAFRSFCNRCKQPRLLVDAKTPPNSKWLPRIGDWICSGCTNNNYASREKCKKCGQPKEVAGVPAIAMPGVFVGGPGGLQPRMGLLGSSTFQQSLPPSSAWPLGAFASNTNNLVQLSLVPKDWRNGDWICNCGFHNYSSRAQCKKCNAAPPAGLHATYPSGSTPVVPNMQGAMHLPQLQIAPALVGKGCKTQKTSAAQPVGVA
ncbi:hypothetical protein Cgig2_007424 [Carnegiea gigantea]|uniref:RanBP2-type domain-containing protein n=1 Tax=Carnegiea gigantea TaxID=171969 RepID=A0A9Q1L026_9CARY|nr:hypothetical protein Cgig2_007424 [Carnegiea gigantea]